MESIHIFNDTLFWAVLALGAIAKIVRYRPIDGTLGVVTVALYVPIALVFGFVVPKGPVSSGIALGLLVAFLGDLAFIVVMEWLIGKAGRETKRASRNGYDETEVEWN